MEARADDRANRITPPDAAARTSRRSFMRAAVATFIGHRDREDPAKVPHSG
jgi:hypothetical protein